MSSETPIAPVPDLDTIVADVERLVKEAHEFIARGGPVPRIASEWVTLCAKLNRRLRQLQQFVDEVPPVLWDIAFAGRDGGGLGGQMQPEVWREYEAQRHASSLEQFANIKKMLVADSAITKTRRGAPKKYPRAMEMALGLLAEGEDTERAIYRKCKEVYGAEERIPKVESFMRTVRRAAAKRRGQS